MTKAEPDLRPSTAIRRNRTLKGTVTGASASPAVALVPAAAARVSLRDLLVLCKPRIVALICLTGLAGAFAGAGAAPPAPLLVTLTLAVALSAAGASVLNHYLERELDSRMQRTSDRPLPSGRIDDPRIALLLGCALLLASVPPMVALGPWVVVFGLLGAGTYAGLYTIVLKPRTSWNIVIGGLAGSFAAVGGWSATASPLEPGALLLGLMLFVWTPPHFWSLAIALQRDYRSAGLPMLPCVVGAQRAAFAILAHVMVLLAVSVAFAVLAGLGPVGVGVIAVAGASLLGASVSLTTHPSEPRARATFKLSGLWLLSVLATIVVDAAL